MNETFYLGRPNFPAASLEGCGESFEKLTEIWKNTTKLG
jgi:hypothetical protein